MGAGSVVFSFILLEISASTYYAFADDIENLIRDPQELTIELAYEDNPPDIRPQLPKLEYNTFTGYLPIPSDKGPGYRVNAQRFRYDFDLEEKESEEIRIFVTGGSFGWGAGVAQKYTYGAVSEKLLSELFPSSKIRVIVAGAAALVSTQERILVENTIYEHDPNIDPTIWME